MIGAENRVVAVSSVIRPIDTFAPAGGLMGEMHFALAPIEGSVHSRNRQPIQHAGDLFIYTNLATGGYAVTVTSDCYFPNAIAIFVGELTEFEKLVVDVELLPRPWYPFPPSATLLRGSVVDAESGRPIAGATVVATYKVARTRTSRIETEVARTYTDNEAFYYGLYALPFKVSLRDMSIRGATPNDLQIQLEVEANGYLPFIGSVAIALHRTTRFDIRLTPSRKE